MTSDRNGRRTGRGPARAPREVCALDALERRVLMDAAPVAANGTSEPPEHRLFFPEGFAGSTIVEFVPIVNPNDQAAEYELIARFETGERDLVVASGTIAASSRGGVTLSNFNDPESNLVPEGRAYALELRSSLPLAATLSHYDFGAATGESFTSEGRFAWYFADALVAEDVSSFLVWQNTAAADARVSVTFFPEDLEIGLLPREVTTGALRRGGLNLAQLGIPEGRYGIVMTCDQPIVAALSQYDSRGGVRSAATELGFPDSGSNRAVLPLARLEEGQSQIIEVFNPFDPTVTPLVDPTATVTLRFMPSDGSLDTVERVLTIGAGQRVRLDAAELRDQLGTGPYAVSYESNQQVVARASHAQGGDVADNAFSRFASSRWHFAEGFMDAGRAGTDVFETISVYNTVDLPAVQNTVTLTFRFTDGTELAHSVSLSPGRHLHLNLHELAPLLEQAQAGRNFYGIEVASDFAVVAQMWHYDLTLGAGRQAGGFGTLGDPGDVLDLGLTLVPFPG